ncbi:COG4705 family protein [Lachnoclostridium phytofermentans]|uniref:Membrane-anchored protein n=1 Tax=Lachnoclostridium phytofermentans (strain ATCC 700394 / DSM 18823 / ISDg) TaxID=357809 RepID=A9KPU6_LACP7|nr:hypothetical protein [Lachnoclostridium phytofermentans]ABX41845.1 protein of unknown function DUF347 [Lachnoclostridium phytofermentans ISDg]
MQKTKYEVMLNKVPEVTIFFWIIKVLCTTVGETVSDFLNVTLGLGLNVTSVVMGVLLAVALVFQFRAKKYMPGLYWMNVALLSVFGTLVTDTLTDALGLPLEISTVGFSICLLLTFLVWHHYEKTLSIHLIYTVRREAFYWLAILFTFALGTASGDLMAEGLGLGYLPTGIIVCAVIICVGIGYKLGLDSVLSFWIAYIMTRPLGASLGDFLSQPKSNGGLGLGTTSTSVIFLAAILATVVFLIVTKKDIRELSTSDQMPTGETSSKSNRRVLIQTIAVICILALLSGSGYVIRQASLANNTNSSVSWSDMSQFVTIEEDVLVLVNNGDFSAAKTRVKDLETTWDQSAAVLKAADKERWKQADSGIDAVLHEIRAGKPDMDSSKIALENSMNMFK